MLWGVEEGCWGDAMGGAALSCCEWVGMLGVLRVGGVAEDLEAMDAAVTAKLKGGEDVNGQVECCLLREVELAHVVLLIAPRHRVDCICCIFFHLLREVWVHFNDCGVVKRKGWDWWCCC